MRIDFVLVLLMCFLVLCQAYPSNKTSNKGKSHFMNGLKKIGEKLRLTGDKSIFRNKPKANTENTHDQFKTSQDTKPSQVAPSSSPVSAPSETSSYTPSIRNQAVPSISSGPAPVTPPPQTTSYVPPIRSGISLSGAGAGNGGHKYTPPVPSQSTRTNTDVGDLMAASSAAAYVTAQQQNQPGPTFNGPPVLDPGSPEISVPDTGGGTGDFTVPIDFSSIPGTGDGGAGAVIDAAGTDCGCGDMIVSCVCAIGGCILDILKSCDPTACCCCN